MFEVPETKYARNGDVTIAYQQVGDGPAGDIVWIPGFLSHLELNWEAPFFRHALERHAAIGRLTTFDKRGTGLSDRDLGFGTLEERMADLLAVMDAGGVERATVTGISEGGPLAIMFAATYPERVDRLALYGTFARLRNDDGYEIGASSEGLEAFFSFLEQYWGTGFALEAFTQHMPDTPEARQLLAKVERYTMTPAMAVQIMRRNAEIDVRPLLGTIQVPTLVVHTTGDPMVPVALGRYLADHIPGAGYTEIDDAFHASWDVKRTDVVVDQLEEFLFGHVASNVDVDRVLTTVLFTDIVDSTRTASTLGDARWKTLLDLHDNIVRQELDRFRGREVNTTGDGFLAMFDGPARAVKCAHAIAQRTRAAGLEIRAGVHTGECETRGDDLAGIAVHVGARVMGLAGNGEVLASRTVRDLVAGSGITFEPRGEHMVKGVEEPVSVFAAV